MIAEIQRFAKENGLEVGICSATKLAAPSDSDRPFAPRGIYEKDKNAKTVVVVGLNMYKIIDSQNDGVPRGRLSFVSLGRDYHRALADKLHSLAAALSRHKVFQYKIHVDTDPLPEKDLAVAAGLGFKGKNGLVISPRFGSFFAIGLLVSELELEENNEIAASGCGNCTRCIEACPTGALGSGRLDWSRCISYLTQSKNLSPEQEALLTQKNPDNYLYGCDCCQLVCPYNQGLTEGERISADAAFPALGHITGMSAKEMKECFGFTAAGWRLGCVKRNAGLCLKNK